MKAFIFFMLVGLSLCDESPPNPGIEKCVIGGLSSWLPDAEDGLITDDVCDLIEAVIDFGCAEILNGNVGSTLWTLEDIVQRSAGAGLSAEDLCNSIEKMKADECRNALNENVIEAIVEGALCNDEYKVNPNIIQVVETLVVGARDLAQCTLNGFGGPNLINELEGLLNSLQILTGPVNGLTRSTGPVNSLGTSAGLLTNLLASLTDLLGGTGSLLGGTGSVLGPLKSVLGSLKSVLGPLKNVVNSLKTTAKCLVNGVKNVEKHAEDLLNKKGSSPSNLPHKLTNLLKALKVLETPQCINSDLAGKILDNPVLKALFEAFGYALIKPS